MITHKMHKSKGILRERRDTSRKMHFLTGEMQNQDNG